MGAGMNVSMQDSYNLVWKIGLVLKGIAKPDILATYTSERQAVAAQLIEYDRIMSSYYSDGPGTNSRDYGNFREKFRTFLSGVSVEYGPNALVTATRKKAVSTNDSRDDTHNSKRLEIFSDQSVAQNILVGQRIPSHMVMNHAEANIVHFHSVLPSDGRWRLLILPGDISRGMQMSHLCGVCDHLAKPASLLHTYTPEGQPIDSVIEVLTVHTAPRSLVEWSDLPDILVSPNPSEGHNYWKVFKTDKGEEDGGYGDAYEKWGVDQHRGCLIVLRPDQHVAYLGGLEDVEEVERYFSQIFYPQKRPN